MLYLPKIKLIPIGGGGLERLATRWNGMSLSNDRGASGTGCVSALDLRIAKLGFTEHDLCGRGIGGALGVGAAIVAANAVQIGQSFAGFG